MFGTLVSSVQWGDELTNFPKKPLLLQTLTARLKMRLLSTSIEKRLIREGEVDIFRGRSLGDNHFCLKK